MKAAAPRVPLDRPLYVIRQIMCCCVRRRIVRDFNPLIPWIDLALRMLRDGRESNFRKLSAVFG